MKRFGILLCILFIVIAGCPGSVQTGLDNIASYQSLFHNKRVGIIANHTAYNQNGEFILDVFEAMDDVTVTAMFGPEHGFEGVARAGEKVENPASNIAGNIPVYSLYGKHRKPTSEMLENVDVLVFDIQDIGTRYYTYISTMALAMESAAEHGKKFVVLDRPNPIDALHVQGNVLDPNFSTFVGLYPIPVRHGMTVGELAMLFNGQDWLEAKRKTDLIVIPMRHYKRKFWYPDTGLQFIKPSPNMVSIDTAAIYPGTCLLEGTNLSEGRGTDCPFLVFGAPWLDASRLTSQLNELKLSGIRFEPAAFTPDSSKYAGVQCHGSRIIITDRQAMEPFWAGVSVINVIYQMNPEQFEWKIKHFDRLCGTDKIRKTIIQQASFDALQKEFQKEIEDFKKIRNQYLLYQE